MNKYYSELERDALPGAFSVYDIEIFVPEVKKLVAGDMYVELGVDRGRSLSIANKVAVKGVKIYGVDIHIPPELELFLSKESRASFYLGDSSEMADNFKGEVNLLFVDANHDYDFVKRDIYSWYPKMAKDGVMLFHDFGVNVRGVKEAVLEFVDTHPEVKFFDLSNNKTSMVKIQL